MFRLKQPTADEIEREVGTVSRRVVMQAAYLGVEVGLLTGLVPRGFAHDRLQTRIGVGNQAFESAIRGLEAWKHFDLGWVRVANEFGFTFN